MKRFQDIWAEQCAAGRRIIDEHGVIAALDYLVGEKLMTYVTTAEEHPEFARELPKFVATVRDIFAPEAISAYVAHLEKIYHEGELASREAAGGDEAETYGEPQEWVAEAERLARIKELLTAQQLGTA